MKTVLLPVKDFKNAKQRLSGVLSPEVRAGLARSMFADVLQALQSSQSAERIIVYTASKEATDMARAFNFETEREELVEGHSAAVNFMLERLTADSSIVLAIASDLPRLSPQDIDFAMDNPPEAITIIHSRDGDGTNGLVFIPPARIEVAYGPGSFSRHLSKASAAGYRAGVLNIPGIAFDI